MWILESIDNGERFYLTKKPLYTVGKIKSDLIIRNDSSISRSHAAFRLTLSHNGVEELHLEDVGSKYGTFIDDGIDSKTCIPKKEGVVLHNGARIRFGMLNSVWNLRHLPLVTMTSSISMSQCQLLEQCLRTLGGTKLTQWESTCTLLTMSELQITVKLLYALLHQIPIVSIEYWRDLNVAVKSQSKSLPETKNYAPQSSDSMQTERIDLRPREERKTLFSGTKFVFMNRTQYDMYEPIISLTGGICISLNKGVPKKMLVDPKVLLIQYIHSGTSQSLSQTISTLEDYLHSHDRRVIPEFEIGLAIVYCSTVKYCNPTYKIVSDLMPSSSAIMCPPSAGGVLAPNTCVHSNMNKMENSEDNIPETEINSQIQVRKSGQPRTTTATLTGKIDLKAANDVAIDAEPVLCESVSPVKRKRDKPNDNSVDDDEEDESLFAFDEKSKKSEKTSVGMNTKRRRMEKDKSSPLQNDNAASIQPQHNDHALDDNEEDGSLFAFNKKSIPSEKTSVGMNTRRRCMEKDKASPLQSHTDTNAASIGPQHHAVDDDEEDGSLFAFSEKSKPSEKTSVGMNTRRRGMEKDKASPLQSHTDTNASGIGPQHHAVDDDEEDGSLFAFSEKSKLSEKTSEGMNTRRRCMEKDKASPLSVAAQKNAKSISTTDDGFLSKPSTSKKQTENNGEPLRPIQKKRVHIAVLTDDDDNEDDDLFNFNDDTPKKRPRLSGSNARENHKSNTEDGELFNFTSKELQQDDITGSAKVSALPTIPKSGVKRAKSTPSLPKAKVLPQHVDTTNWLQKPSQKSMNGALKNEEDVVDADGQIIKIKQEDPSFDTSIDQTWIDSFKNGLSVSIVGLPLRKNWSTITVDASTASQANVKNFKTFVKVYQRPM